jgi:hypothetical protein
MTQYTPSAPRRPFPPVGGLALFGGAMLVVVGLLDLCYGVMAELHEEAIVSTRDYAFQLSTETWGWWHVGVGLLLAVLGGAAVGARGWARIAGIVVVGLAAVGNFLSVPYAPLWALVLLALDVFVMWSLAATEPGAGL